MIFFILSVQNNEKHFQIENVPLKNQYVKILKSLLKYILQTIHFLLKLGRFDHNYFFVVFLLIFKYQIIKTIIYDTERIEKNTINQVGIAKNVEKRKLTILCYVNILCNNNRSHPPPKTCCFTYCYKNGVRLPSYTYINNLRSS